MNEDLQKAEKLVKEFDYLKSKPYYPYGKEGKEFKIDSLFAIPESAKRTPETMALMRQDKDYIDNKNKELAQGDNWYVKVIISDSITKIEKDLKDVLSRLKIQHDINNIPN